MEVPLYCYNFPIRIIAEIQKLENLSMKKIIISSALLLCLSAFSFAGEQHSGGKTCGNGQTSCLTGDQTTGGKGEQHTGGLLDMIEDYLKGIFG